mgnify:CR=1 FL=1
MSEPMISGRFVVLEHRWDGVHWDFMLEVGGGLATWAIGAPIHFDRDLPARKLADHRIDYLTYEGPVSRDRGTVRLLGSGTFHALEWETDLVRLRLEGDQLVGGASLWISESERGRCWMFRIGNVD